MPLPLSLMTRTGPPPTPPGSFQSAADLVSLGFVVALLLLSLLSLAFVLRLRCRNPAAALASHFNSLWAVRLLLVSFVSLWTLSHLIRLLLPRRTSLCKLHILLSLGLLEPGFLITILYLVDASVSERNTCAVAVVFSACLPVLALQTLALYLPLADLLSLLGIFRSSPAGNQGDPAFESSGCACPPPAALVFAAFGFSFLIFFLLSCRRVMSVVINKGLRARIYVLALAVSISLSMEILFLGLSTRWGPEEASHTTATMVAFLSALSCAAAGEGLLVIRPIADALAAGECAWHGRVDAGSRRSRVPGGSGDCKDMIVFS